MAPAKTMAAPPEAQVTPGPATNGHGDRALAEAAETLAQARARVRALDTVRDDPSATRLARLQAERDLLPALIEEKNAEIAQLECAEQARAEHLRHKAAEHTRLEPAIRAAAREVHESLEALRDGAYARLLTALLAYQRGTGDSYKFASDVSWPTAVFARAEGSDEDLIAYRRRYLAGLGFLD